MSALTFPTGTYHFNDHPLFDFQLNRVVMWNHEGPGGGPGPGRGVTDFPSWERALKELSAQAEARRTGRQPPGIFRMAEFFMVPDTPECHAVYDRARRSSIHTLPTCCLREQGGPIHREEVPYADGSCPAGGSCPTAPQGYGILFHGGNDSLLEEFTDALLYLAQGGYTVLAFEGPARGGPAEIRPDLHTGVGKAGGRGAGSLWGGQCDHHRRLPRRGAVHAGGSHGAAHPAVVSWSVLPSIYGALMADKPARSSEAGALAGRRTTGTPSWTSTPAWRSGEPLFRWSISTPTTPTALR